jgi:hypothetical protein
MITNLICSITPSKAKSKEHQVPKDDDDQRTKAESKVSGNAKRITQTTLSYAGATKKGKNNDDPDDDKMTDDTSKSTIHDEEHIPHLKPPKPRTPISLMARNANAHSELSPKKRAS